MIMEPHLFLTRGKKRLLLVRYFDKFHFIELNHRCTNRHGNGSLPVREPRRK